MSKQFMPELTRRERVQILQQNADKIEQTTYQKPLSSDELAERREQLSENHIRLNDLQEELDNVKADFKLKMDPLKEQNKVLLNEIKFKQTSVMGTLYHMANHDESMMETYDDNGEMVASRRLRPDEKQGRLTLNIAQ